MLHSMTGFGRAVLERGNRTAIVEIRCLNSKYLDLNLRFPSAYRHKEPDIRNKVGKALSRGKIDLTISLDSTDPAVTQHINRKLATAYYRELESLRHELGADSDLLSIIFRMPEVLQPDNELADDEGWALVQEALEKALNAANAFRQQEGASLDSDLRSQVQAILDGLEEVEKLDPERKKLTRERLENSLKEWVGEGKADPNRFEEELIYYLEKMDISEEKVRLRNHCKYFVDVLDEPVAHKGKQLNFISQEMGREINTLGSKAAHAPIQKLVVQMKDALEKIKEQVLNAV